MSINSWAEALACAKQRKACKIPAGFVTAKKLEKIWGLSNAQVHKRLCDLKKDGIVEMKKFYVKTIEGTFHPTPHYKLIKK